MKIWPILLSLSLPTTLFAAGYDKWDSTVRKAIDQRNGVGVASNTIETLGADSNLNENKATLRSEAFKQLLDKTSPLTPEQIIELRKQIDASQQAVATQANPPPKPMSSTLKVDLSPGAMPPIVRLGAGFVSSLVFVDSSGQSWPIVDYSLGNPKNFNIQWDKKTNTLFIQSTSSYATGNMALRLANLDTPVMISLVAGQREVDYRVDLQIPGHGPNALAPTGGQDMPGHVSSNLLSVLDGVPPFDSQELKLASQHGRAWISNGKLIFRTKLTLLSPAWVACVTSPDGTHVYEMMQTPLILASEDGKPVKIELRGL